MYSYYGNSVVCYAYLADVYILSGTAVRSREFEESGWFQRGWTLQELVAPRSLVFLNAHWEVIADRASLSVVVSCVTGIPAAVLEGRKAIKDVDLFERMAWCAGRETTKPPDLAYCLSGILGVSLTPDNTEDAGKAFERLHGAPVQQYPAFVFPFYGGGDIYKMLLRQSTRARLGSPYSESNTTSLSPDSHFPRHDTKGPSLRGPLRNSDYSTLQRHTNPPVSAPSISLNKFYSPLLDPDLKYVTVQKSDNFNTAIPRYLL